MNMNSKVGNMNIKIMIVDDDEIDREHHCRLLNKAGYHHIKAYPSAQKALEVLKKDPSFDCILTDFKMPVMNGVEFSRSIQQIPSYSPIIVMITGQLNKEIMPSLTNHDIHGYLIKGNINKNVLHQTIQKAFQSDSPSSL